MSNHALTPLVGRTLAYTDGACRGNPGKGGFGAVVILPTGEQIDICGGEAHTTNNRMELMGAIAALENSPKALPIQIWSDSGKMSKMWNYGSDLISCASSDKLTGNGSKDMPVMMAMNMPISLQTKA